MNKEKLELWQGRLGRAETAYADEAARFDVRESIYRGRRETSGLTRDDRDKNAVHVRNIAMELIEAQADTSVPQPKVTARREADQPLAKIIEDMLRCELDRIPMEEVSDMLARTVPIQGGAAMLVEWDNTQRTHESVGELWVSAIHPKQLVPQPGVYSSIEDMDWVILKLPETKEFVRRRYGIDVDGESESEPGIRGADVGEGGEEDLVTVYCAYYRNASGGIGKYVWVNGTELEDLEDYQARRLNRCGKCGSTDVFVNADGKKECRVCGSRRIVSETLEYEEIREEIPGVSAAPNSGDSPAANSRAQPSAISDGDSAAPNSKSLLSAISDGGMVPSGDGEARPVRVPYYKPDIFPVILQKNVSVYGQLLGASDLDAIEDQQNTTNRIEGVIIDKLVQSGSYMTIPDKVGIRVDTEHGKVIRFSNAADVQGMNVYDMEGRISQDMAYLAQVYEEARQIIGITDSFQGRRDTTATSGRAKEFAAAQTAGRLESKRAMKNAAYAALFEAMFRFRLAYTDEPIPIRTEGADGSVVYEEFNRWDFLERDADGEWYWNDAFLFSADSSTPLAQNREAMWQETRLNFSSGTFGDPKDIRTLILFWQKMEALHYPDAGQTRMYLERQLAGQREREEQEQELRQRERQQREAQEREQRERIGAEGLRAQPPQTRSGGRAGSGGLTGRSAADGLRARLGEIDAAARRDAERTVLAEIDRLAGRRAAEDALKARAAQDRTGRNDR